MTTPPTDERQGWTSASNAEADSLCAGRHLAQKGLVEDTSAAAVFGNKVHLGFAGEAVDLNITQERLLERAEEREKKVLARFPNNTFEVHNEIREWAEQRGWKHSGQADKLFLDAKMKLALIEDLKSLRGVVADSPENMQLRDLAVLAWLNYGVEEVVVFINQPMAGEHQKITRYDQSTLAQAWSYMKLRITNSNDPNSKRTAGEIQCNFCRARGICPESLAWEKRNTVLLMKRGELAAEMVARIAPEKVADIWLKSKTITSILEAVKDRLLSMPDDDLEKLGISRRKGFFRETINDNKELAARLKKLGLKQADIMAHMKMTKGNLEELVRQASCKKGKELDILMDEVLSGIVDREQTADGLERLK